MNTNCYVNIIEDVNEILEWFCERNDWISKHILAIKVAQPLVHWNNSELIFTHESRNVMADER